MLCALDHIVDGLAYHIEPRDNFVGERVVVPAFRLLMIECQLQRLHFSFKLELFTLK